MASQRPFRSLCEFLCVGTFVAGGRGSYYGMDVDWPTK